MKAKFCKKLGVTFMTTLMLLPAFAKYDSQIYASSPNYVVIGAFAIQKNAVRFARKANNQEAEHLKSKASYELNANRNLYYVYVLMTEDHDQAINEAKRLRNETEFSDTWVYNGSLKKSDGNSAPPVADINPITKETLIVSPADNVVVEPKVEQKNNESLSADLNTTTTVVASPILPKENVASIPDNGVEGKKFLFKLFRADDQTSLEGDVDAIDTERSKKMGTYKGNVPVKVTTPQGKSGKISLVCEVFGFRKVQRELDYNSPIADDITVDESNDVVVPFELMRLQKGDIAIMYNVYFFKDAGIMRPESRFEVNSLLEMMKENEKYKIKLHGHTNGGAAGKVISMGPGKNFFSLIDTKEGVGSAKKLSEERANVIKEYLVANGIAETRMEVKAWGGKRPIQDKHSNRAQENVRVEVEILEN